MTDLVSAVDLAKLLRSEARVRLLDVRWSVTEPDGRGAYVAGHVPDAVFVDLESDLSRHGVPEDGRHPIPNTTDLQAAARRWGIDDGDIAVAYDDNNNVAAARAWWLLRRAGVKVLVLDGGLRAWVNAGHELQTGQVTPTKGTATLREAHDARDALTIDEAAAFPVDGVLIDVRAPERYRGEVEPIDPVAGHIPGAVNVPTTLHVGEDGMFLDAEVLRATFARVGASENVPVAVYCGSGITATHTVLALAEAGISAALYPGSWSQWVNTPGRPVAVGARPSGSPKI